MRCASYCTAEEYKITELVELFEAKNIPYRIFEKEVIHIKFEDLFGDEPARAQGDVFIFKLGNIVFWDCDTSEERRAIDKLSSFTIKRYKYKEIEIEECKYKIEFSKETHIEEERDLIVLDNNNVVTKLSISYAMAHSTKLAFFEESVKKTIKDNKNLPIQMIKSGKIALSGKDLVIKMGELFLERSQVNLHSDILYAPDFFWRRPKYEYYYNMVIQFMDMEKRINILNKKLDVINELYGILSGELQHHQSSRLEIIIVILIFVEVILAVFRDILHLI